MDYDGIALRLSRVAMGSLESLSGPSFVYRLAALVNRHSKFRGSTSARYTVYGERWTVYGVRCAVSSNATTPQQRGDELKRSYHRVAFSNPYVFVVAFLGVCHLNTRLVLRLVIGLRISLGGHGEKSATLILMT